MELYYYFQYELRWYIQNFHRANLYWCIGIFAAGVLGYFFVDRFLVRRKEKGEERDPVQPGKSIRRAGCLRGIVFGLLISYFYLVLYYTLLVRGTYDVPHYTLEIFWSYKKAIRGSKSLLVEIILNWLLLLPEGLLLPALFYRRKKQARFGLACLVGFLTTSAIELSQLLFRRGLFEFDDIFGNFMGVLIGAALYLLFSSIGDRIYKMINLKRDARKAEKVIHGNFQHFSDC